MSQTAFAAIVGASKRAMISWEKDDSAPTATALAAWAEAGADTLFIVTGRRSTPDQPNAAPAQIADDLDGIRRGLLDPSRRRLPDDTEEQAEERAVSGAQRRLRAMLQYDAKLMSPELTQEVEHLLDLAENPASLALYRAADHAQMRKRRREMRERIVSWFDSDRYQPNETVLNAMVAQVLDYGVPHKRLVELVQDVFDDAGEWLSPGHATG